MVADWFLFCHFFWIYQNRFLCYYCKTIRTTMSCISSVVSANDEMIVAVHKIFTEWQKTECLRVGKNHLWKLPKNQLSWALLHYEKCKRSITRICGTFNSKQSYVRAIVTTRIIGNKTFWQPHNAIGWKQASRQPPPCPKNGGHVKVLFNHNRDAVYRCVDCLYVVIHCKLMQ